jgi:hypothetical protein
MDYLPFAAMVIAIAAGLAGLAARLALPARIRDAGTVAVILGAAATAFLADLPGPLHARLYGPSVPGTPGAAPETGAGGSLLHRLLGGMSEARRERHIAAIKDDIRKQNLDWLFDDDTDIESLARQAMAEAGNDTERLAQASARLVSERAVARMNLLHEARLAEVTGVIDGMIETLSYFIDNAQFGNCRTFLLGGYSYPGADQQVMVRLAHRLGAAVKSGQRGEKDWVELSPAELETHTASAVTHLLENGYTVNQLNSMARLDTTDPAEMETNCRFTRDLFAHLVNEYPPDVAATAYISEP